jgi:hypothetical protein
VEHALPENGKLFAIYRRLLRQFVDVGSGDKRLFSRARENQHAHRCVIARIQQHLLQFLDGLAV